MVFFLFLFLFPSLALPSSRAHFCRRADVYCGGLVRGQQQQQRQRGRRLDWTGRQGGASACLPGEGGGGAETPPGFRAGPNINNNNNTTRATAAAASRLRSAPVGRGSGTDGRPHVAAALGRRTRRQLLLVNSPGGEQRCVVFVLASWCWRAQGRRTLSDLQSLRACEWLPGSGPRTAQRTCDRPRPGRGRCDWPSPGRASERQQPGASQRVCCAPRFAYHLNNPPPFSAKQNINLPDGFPDRCPLPALLRTQVCRVLHTPHGEVA